MNIPDSRAGSRTTTGAQRDPAGRWLPGAPSPNPAGRAPKVREVEIHEASARGCSAEDWEGICHKLVELALAGDVPAARLLAQVRGAIGQEQPAHVEVGQSIGEALTRDPALAGDISALMDRVFSSAPSPGGSP